MNAVVPSDDPRFQRINFPAARAARDRAEEKERSALTVHFLIIAAGVLGAIGVVVLAIKIHDMRNMYEWTWESVRWVCNSVPVPPGYFIGLSISVIFVIGGIVSLVTIRSSINKDWNREHLDYSRAEHAQRILHDIDHLSRETVERKYKRELLLDFGYTTKEQDEGFDNLAEGAQPLPSLHSFERSEKS